MKFRNVVSSLTLLKEICTLYMIVYQAWIQPKYLGDGYRKVLQQIWYVWLDRAFVLSYCTNFVWGSRTDPPPPSPAFGSMPAHYNTLY